MIAMIAESRMAERAGGERERERERERRVNTRAMYVCVCYRGGPFFLGGEGKGGALVFQRRSAVILMTSPPHTCLLALCFV